MSTRIALIQKARQLGYDYLSVYRGCAPTTLLAVADTLNMPVSDEMFQMVSGLSSVSGGCGGICGAAAAIGLRFGVARKRFHDVSNPPAHASLSPQIIRTVKRVRDRFVDTYGGYLCCEIQTTLFGRAFDVTIPTRLQRFVGRTCMGSVHMSRQTPQAGR